MIRVGERREQEERGRVREGGRKREGERDRERAGSTIISKGISYKDENMYFVGRSNVRRGIVIPRR